MSLVERERVWWVGLATGTVGTWTTDEASVEAARAAGWRVEEFVPAATASGAVEDLRWVADGLADINSGRRRNLGITRNCEVRLREVIARLGGQ